MQQDGFASFVQHISGFQTHQKNPNQLSMQDRQKINNLRAIFEMYVPVVPEGGAANLNQFEEEKKGEDDMQIDSGQKFVGYQAPGLAKKNSEKVGEMHLENFMNPEERKRATIFYKQMEQER